MYVKIHLNRTRLTKVIEVPGREVEVFKNDLTEDYLNKVNKTTGSKYTIDNMDDILCIIFSGDECIGHIVKGDVAFIMNDKGKILQKIQ
jgi:hypothetical protein